MPGDSSGFCSRLCGMLPLDGPAAWLPSPPANHPRVNDPHCVESPYGAALRARVSHAVASARSIGSRLHKRPGQALSDPPRNAAAAVTTLGKYGGEPRRDKLKWTNTCLRMSSQMSPFCPGRRGITAATPPSPPSLPRSREGPGGPREGVKM